MGLAEIKLAFCVFLCYVRKEGSVFMMVLVPHSRLVVRWPMVVLANPTWPCAVVSGLWQAMRGSSSHHDFDFFFRSCVFFFLVFLASPSYIPFSFGPRSLSAVFLQSK